MSERDRTDQLIAQQDRDEAERERRPKPDEFTLPAASYCSRYAVLDLSRTNTLLYDIVAQYGLRPDERSDRWEEGLRDAVVALVRKNQALEARLRGLVDPMEEG